MYQTLNFQNLLLFILFGGTSSNSRLCQVSFLTLGTLLIFKMLMDFGPCTRWFSDHACGHRQFMNISQLTDGMIIASWFTIIRKFFFNKKNRVLQVLLIGGYTVSWADILPMGYIARFHYKHHFDGDSSVSFLYFVLVFVWLFKVSIFLSLVLHHCFAWLLQMLWPVWLWTAVGVIWCLDQGTQLAWFGR